MRRLQTQEPGDSCDEEQDFDIPDEPHPMEKSEHSDSSDSDHETAQNQQDPLSATVDSSQNQQNSMAITVGTTSPSDEYLKARNGM